MPVGRSAKGNVGWGTRKTEEDDEIPLLGLQNQTHPSEEVRFSHGFYPHHSASSSSVNAFEMRSRTRPEPSTTTSLAATPYLNPGFVLVDIPIEQGDTLPSFAIKYHVTTAELKRINNMFHDQDFHSRQDLKVPIHRYGILAERYLRQAAVDDPPEHVLVDLSSHTTSPTTTLPSTPTSEQQDEKMDANLQRLARDAQERRPRSPVAEDDLLSSRYRVESLPTAGDGLGCDSADCGINVKALLCMVLCLTIVLPAAFLLFKLYCIHHPDACPEGLHQGLTNRSGMAHDHLH